MPDASRPSRRTTSPRQLREVLAPEVARLAASEQARAYAAWARACGAPVMSNAHPTAFFKGVLTVGCSSSVWANELTYMSGQIISRMDEVAPGHTVRRLRFVVEGTEAHSEGPEAEPSRRGNCHRQLNEAVLGGAREAARGVTDDRLRQAIEAALRASTGRP